MAWGDNGFGQTTIPAGRAGSLEIAAGGYHCLALKPDRSLSATLQPIGSNYSSAFALSGPKALLTAVLELGLPYTLERDDALHGFLYGSESLVDHSAALAFLQDENAKLLANPGAMPQTFADVAIPRYQAFAQRLGERLVDLQASGQPELPRMVGHTLRLQNLLREAWTPPANSPPTALEISRATSGLALMLHGEPYARYSLEQSTNLIGWANTTPPITNLRSTDSPVGIVSTNVPTTVGPQRYYRAVQLVP